MTKKSSKGGKRTTKQSKRLSVSKQTLKDLSVRKQGPAGGRMRQSDACDSVACLPTILYCK